MTKAGCGHQPERQCVACRRMKPKDQLLRVALTKDREPVCDFTGKMPGRGAYICRDKDCLRQAEKRKALTRSLHCAVPSDIYRALEKAIGEDLER